MTLDPGDNIGERVYEKFLPRGVNGSRGDAGHIDELRQQCRSFVPYGKLLFGVPQQRGMVKLPDGTDRPSNVMGVSMFEQVINEEVRFAPPFPEGWPPLSYIQILSRGRVMVIGEQQVTYGDPVFYRTKQLDPDGSDTLGLLTLSMVPTAGSWTPRVLQGIQGFTGAPLAHNFTALDLQNCLNAIVGIFPMAVVVTGDQVRGFTIDWGPFSQGASYSLLIAANSLTASSIPVNLNYVQLVQGYPPGIRYGVGSFRKDSDFGSCADANLCAPVRRFAWSQPSDSNGVAILEIL